MQGRIFISTGDGDCIGDVVFVVDSSSSIGQATWPTSLQCIIDIIKDLKVDPSRTHVGVVTYSNEVEVSFGLNNYTSLAEIETAVFEIKYMAGGTNTGDGIKKMHEVIKKEGRGANVAIPIAIIITDGVTNIIIDATRTIPEAQSARDDGIQLFAVGM